MPQPIAANLNGASTILAEAFPASFITFDPLVFYRLDYVKKTERLICKVMLDLRGHDNGIAALTLAQPHRTAWFSVLNPFYNGQHIECAVGKVYQLSH